MTTAYAGLGRFDTTKLDTVYESDQPMEDSNGKVTDQAVQHGSRSHGPVFSNSPQQGLVVHFGDSDSSGMFIAFMHFHYYKGRSFPQCLESPMKLHKVAVVPEIFLYIRCVGRLQIRCQM